MGNLAAAKQACAPLLEGGSVSAVSRRLSGMIAYREGDSKRALSELNEAVRLSPGDAETRTALGVALLQVGDLPGAAAALEEAARLDPGSQSAVSNLAKVYDRQGRDADAESARKRFQEIHEMRSLRQKVAPLQAKGVEAYNAGRLDEALESFQAVLKMSPRDPEALAHLGSVYIALQKLEEAERYLKQALEVLPEDAFALTEMGRVRALRRRSRRGRRSPSARLPERPRCSRAPLLSGGHLLRPGPEGGFRAGEGRLRATAQDLPHARSHGAPGDARAVKRPQPGPGPPRPPIPSPPAPTPARIRFGVRGPVHPAAGRARRQRGPSPGRPEEEMKREEGENQGNGSASGDSAETGKDRSGSPWIVIPSTR